MPVPHYYKHLDNDKNFNVTVELNMEQLAEEVCKKNYGLHRFLSEVIDIKRKSGWEQDKAFADELEHLLSKGYN